MGGVIEKEGAIHISNVMLLDPELDEPTRVASSATAAGRRRVASRSGEEID